MPLIVETIVTTMDVSGEPHIAPLGLIETEGLWIVAPFKPSRTLDNLRAKPVACASHTDDVRVFAGIVTGRRNWPLVATQRIDGMRLEGAVSHWELEVDSVTEDDVRPRFLCRAVRSVSHKPWGGYNRAQAAILELAVLVTRLHMLPPEKVETELKYLEIAVSKTAGPREMEAWGWLMDAVAAWRRGEGRSKA